MHETNITHYDIMNKNKQKLQEITKTWGTTEWQQNISNKSSLQVYRAWKTKIKEAQCYDNRPSSIIQYKARANCLPLHDRKRHTNENTTCNICQAENETLIHFLLHRPAYQTERSKAHELQQPYEENPEQIIGTSLFSEKCIEDKNDIL